MSLDLFCSQMGLASSQVMSCKTTRDFKEQSLPESGAKEFEDTYSILYLGDKLCMSRLSISCLTEVGRLTEE